jgi:hypothetical protein
MPDAAKVHVYDGTTLKSSSSVDGSGNWSATGISLSAGMHTINCKSEDVAGNMSSSSAKHVYTGCDATPTCDLLDDSVGGGTSSDNITNDNTPRVKLTIDLGTPASAMGAGCSSDSVDSMQLQRKTSAASSYSTVETDNSPTKSGNTWYFTHQVSSAMADGVWNWRGLWTDALGNSSAYGSILNTTIDTTAPSSPTVSAPTNYQVFVGTSITVSGSAS